MRSLLITGANRGIGLELVKQFLKHPSAKPEILIATARKPNEAKELQELASQDKTLHILPLDVTKFDLFKDFVKSVSGIVGEKGLNVLFNNAGILLDKDAKLDSVTVESLTTQFTSNTVAPIILTKELLPLVKKAALSSSGGISIDRAALVYMSSVLGSVKSNEGPYGGGYWGYRESKAALDIAARTICKEVSPDGIGVLVLHPGWVQTDMGGPNALITTSQSVQGLIKVILSLSDKTNGAFIQHDGATLPW
ncbi:C-factor-like isoform X2 [Macrosteles quadrilineatus]|nr:C-factor-like isoform X2 [Macrosteles quadrilineatus]